jgi:hypothetical protein
LAQEVSAIRKRVTAFSIVGLVLLLGCIGTNIVLYLYASGKLH